MKRKILISAYGCWPGRGSELGVGWNWCVQMSKNNELYILTIKRSQKDIETALKNLPMDVQSNIHFYYFDYPKWVIELLPAATIRWYLYYVFWQIGIIPKIINLQKNVHFDYSMSLTFGSVWLPTVLPLFNIPFIWGPWGGADYIPEDYLDSISYKKGGLLHWLQTKRKWLSLHICWLPHIRFSMYRASAILCRTYGNRSIVPDIYQNKCFVVLETAMSETSFDLNNIQNKKRTKIRILTTGRLIPSKNISMAISAIYEASKSIEIQYDIIGDGPEFNNLENLISKYNIHDKVKLVKAIPRETLLQKIKNYDIYLFPSLLEGGSWALMEAMQYGLPIICFDCSGMSVVTDDKCAIRIPITNPSQSLLNMVNAIIKLSSNPDLRLQMGVNAYKKIQNEFSWETKGEFMEKLFNDLEKHNKQ